MYVKTYPYLQDSYYEDANSQKQRREILKNLDDMVNQKRYVKITLLNWDETAIKEISGELTTGSISKDGRSSVRRTASFSADTVAINDIGALPYSLSGAVFAAHG